MSYYKYCKIGDMERKTFLFISFSLLIPNRTFVSQHVSQARHIVIETILHAITDT